MVSFTPPKIQIDDLIQNFETASRSSDLLKKAYTLCSLGKFVDDKGRVDDVGKANVSVTLEEGALLYYLMKHLKPRVTFETGFGGGVSAFIFVASKDAGSLFETRKHTSIDPYGLAGDVGSVVRNYLKRHHGRKFRIIKDRSEIVLPRLVSKYKHKVGLSLIDGSHLFDHALVDFVYLEQMCSVGGCVMLDDIDLPPVRAALSFIEKNKPNFVVQKPLSSMALLWKTQKDDGRKWDHFQPFIVA